MSPAVRSEINGTGQAREAYDPVLVRGGGSTSSQFPDRPPVRLVVEQGGTDQGHIDTAVFAVHLRRSESTDVPPDDFVHEMGLTSAVDVVDALLKEILGPEAFTRMETLFDAEIGDPELLIEAHYNYSGGDPVDLIDLHTRFMDAYMEQVPRRLRAGILLHTVPAE